MSYPLTLDGAPSVPSTQPVCAICTKRTRGATTLVRLRYGVSVWLCHAHASPEYQRRHSGQDFVLTLERLWQAHGCLTASRRKALEAHLERLRERPPARRPGSYTWSALRLEAEALYARGIPSGGGRPDPARPLRRRRCAPAEQTHLHPLARRAALARRRTAGALRRRHPAPVGALSSNDGLRACPRPPAPRRGRLHSLHRRRVCTVRGERGGGHADRRRIPPAGVDR